MLFLATLFLAYSNGANDNFKGVATLFGSGVTDYRKALLWATLTTLAGSICAIFMAEELVRNFSGKGWVPDDIADSAGFVLSVALSAALTVILATVAGFPISTTHAITGGLFGVGWVAVGSAVNFSKLGGAFFLPLLVSPLIAIVLSTVLYGIFHGLRRFSGVTEESCVCIDGGAPVAAPAGAVPMTPPAAFEITTGTAENCARRYKGTILGISCQAVLDGAHFFSAGAVCFARGMNDTPKIVALMLLVKSLNISSGMLAVALGMAMGGLIGARKVAETMSRKMTALNHGQGFTANLTTAALVILASHMGMPVSTTHVSVGAIAGIGWVTKNAKLNVVAQIALSWLLTLPIAALFGAALYMFLQGR